MNRLHRALVACLLLSALASAQVTVTVGPPSAPIGCPIKISIANDTAATVGTGACPFSVFNSATGAVVYQPLICTLQIIPIGPGQVYTFNWNQTNNSGVQVPAGTYDVVTQIPGGGSSTSTITIGAAAAGISLLGPQRPGTARNLFLCSPMDGSQIYFLAASGSIMFGGIPTCTAQNFPLDFDGLLVYSTGVQSNFLNMIGVLNSSGQTTAPQVVLPALPALSGATYYMSFIVLDYSLPCPVRRISAVTPITIL